MFEFECILLGSRASLECCLLTIGRLGIVAHHIRCYDGYIDHYSGMDGSNHHEVSSLIPLIPYVR